MCGMELRSPSHFSFNGFNQFNAGYIDVLKRWDILFDGMNPVARTNIAPEVNPPGEPSLYGFSYTVPSKSRRENVVVAEQASCRKVHWSRRMWCGGETPARPQFRRKRTSSWG